MNLLQTILDSIVGHVIDVNIALAVAALMFFAFSAVTLYRNRNKVVFGEFTCSDSSIEGYFTEFSALTEAAVRRVLDIHRNHQRAAVDLKIFQHLAPQSSSEEIRLDELVPGDLFRTVVKSALLVLGRLVYPPTVSGIVHRAGDEATLEATIDVRNRGRHQLESVSRPISALRFQQRIARDLALIVIRHQSPEMSIRNWQALDKFTEALTIWPPATTVTDGTESRFRETEDALLAAQEYDPDSPLINFNLALLYYGKFDAEYNERALVLFDKATRTANLHLKGLAKIGLARCYCQKYHRFGQQTQVVLDKARATSAEAVELIKQAMREARKADAEHLKYDYARALYCRAFAQHVTEKPEDIERGVRDYLEVIDITKPNVPDFVYNNLGYILMAKKGRFEPCGGPSDYDDATRYLNLALEQEPNQKMALANLGNVERLKGNYSEAIGRYREALEIDPNYANGWNELAWVYLEAGQPDEAEAAHEKALSLASSPDYQYDIKENYARMLYRIGRRAEALTLVRDVQKANPDKITTNEWLAEIEGEMSAS